jgi:hypothetical protein
MCCLGKKITLDGTRCQVCNGNGYIYSGQTYNMPCPTCVAYKEAVKEYSKFQEKYLKECYEHLKLKKQADDFISHGLIRECKNTALYFFNKFEQILKSHGLEIGGEKDGHNGS